MNKKICLSFIVFNTTLLLANQFDEAVNHLTEKRFDQAIELFSALHAHYPDNPAIAYNCAYAHKAVGNMLEALPLYQQVLAQQPQNVSAHIGIAQAYLATGNFIDGWQELGWRVGGPPLPEIEQFRKIIENNQSLDNKIVLLHAEWGMGDLMQMIRYAQLIKARGATVVVAVIHRALIPLLSLCPSIDKLMSLDEPLLYHLRVPIMSLPVVFGTTLATIPAQIPYLYADKQLINRWHERLIDDKNFKIGICWRGNTIHDPAKFIPLEQLARLATINGISLYSLQQIHGLDQLDTLPHNAHIISFDDFDAQPFMDTAALMENLDLIITVDTSVAHLAGALGRPVWVILPKNADWRWLQERSDCPWYPTMQLFRQTKAGEWGDLMENIIQQILAMHT